MNPARHPKSASLQVLTRYVILIVILIGKVLFLMMGASGAQFVKVERSDPQILPITGNVGTAGPYLSADNTIPTRGLQDMSLMGRTVGCFKSQEARRIFDTTGNWHWAWASWFGFNGLGLPVPPPFSTGGKEVTGY